MDQLSSPSRRQYVVYTHVGGLIKDAMSHLNILHMRFCTSPVHISIFFEDFGLQSLPGRMKRNTLSTRSNTIRILLVVETAVERWCKANSR